MGLQKEREAFEAWISEVCPHVKMDLNAKTECEYDSSSMSLAWYAWQAAKASAVPDGFKLVSFKQISELVVAVNKVDLMTHTEQKTDEVRLAWQNIASKLQAMIEVAQEQS